MEIAKGLCRGEYNYNRGRSYNEESIYLQELGKRNGGWEMKRFKRLDPDEEKLIMIFEGLPYL